MSKVTLRKGGTGVKTVDIRSVHIPDLWHIAQAQPDPKAKEAILEVWHLAHDFKNHILEGGDQ